MPLSVCFRQSSGQIVLALVHRYLGVSSYLRTGQATDLFVLLASHSRIGLLTAIRGTLGLR